MWIIHQNNVISSSDEPIMYKSATDRRKSVFAEPYNPDEDDGDEAKVEQYESVDTSIQHHLLLGRTS